MFVYMMGIIVDISTWIELSCISNVVHHAGAMLWLKQLVTDLSLWKPRFKPWPVCVGFMIEKVEDWQVFRCIYISCRKQLLPCHVCLSIQSFIWHLSIHPSTHPPTHPFAYISLAPSGWIVVKFDTGGPCENLWRKSLICLKMYNNIRNITT